MANQRELGRLHPGSQEREADGLAYLLGDRDFGKGLRTFYPGIVRICG